jgi:hypothetical protein
VLVAGVEVVMLVDEPVVWVALVCVEVMSLTVGTPILPTLIFIDANVLLGTACSDSCNRVVTLPLDAAVSSESTISPTAPTMLSNSRTRMTKLI